MWVIAGLLPVVVLVWLGLWTTDASLVTIYTEGEALPDVRRLPHKLSTLLNPGTLGAILGPAGSGRPAGYWPSAGCRRSSSVSLRGMSGLDSSQSSGRGCG